MHVHSTAVICCGVLQNIFKLLCTTLPSVSLSLSRHPDTSRTPRWHPSPFTPSPHSCQNTICQQAVEQNAQGLRRYAPHLLHLFNPPHVRTGCVNRKRWGPATLFVQGAQKVTPSPFYPSFSPTHATTGHSFAHKGHTQQLPHLLPAPHSHEKTTCE